VPIGDDLLFGEYDYCLNLGGIANISYRTNDGRKAFDICACNMALNYLAGRVGKEYDEGGNLARSGDSNPELLSELNKWPYLMESPPKSLGFEQISAEIFPLLSADLPVNDLLSTFVDHIAEQISRACPVGGSLLMTGGGAHNTCLRERLANFRPDLELIYPDPLIVNFKEAIIFAFLGAMHEWGRVNVLSSVTGAERDHISGQALG
jgi:anhydro-N-acetylmuramic acid kinase